MKFLTTALFAFSMLCTSGLFAQDHTVSASGNFGWAIPGGSGVSELAEDLNLDGGIVFGVDVLYHLKPKLLVGINYTNALLAGGGEGDIDIFGSRMIGLKALYQLKDEGFRPFVGLSLGLSQLTTPEFTITDATGNSVTVPENSGSGFGIMPEIGLQFGGGFYILGQYLVPTSYTIEEAFVEDKAMGTINILLGYRHTLEF